MKILIAGEPYFVKWSHKTIMVDKGKKGESILQIPRRITTCQIHELSSGENKLVSFGETQCSEKDLFIKETGRKISLSRALINFGSFFNKLSKEERSEVWDQYHNRSSIENTAEINHITILK